MVGRGWAEHLLCSPCAVASVLQVWKLRSGAHAMQCLAGCTRASVGSLRASGQGASCWMAGAGKLMAARQVLHSRTVGVLHIALCTCCDVAAVAHWCPLVSGPRFVESLLPVCECVQCLLPSFSNSM